MLTKQRELNASPGRFKMLIAYDQLDNGINGKKTCERLLRRVREKEPDFEADISVLKLSLLDDPRMNKEWLDAAVKTDLIVLSVQYETPLPLAVKNWISNWLGRRQNRLQAIVAVLNWRRTDFPEVSPVQRYLREFVRNNCVALFTHFEEIPDTAEENPVEQLQVRAHCITSVLQDAMKVQPSWSRSLAS